jgi:integrase
VYGDYIPETDGGALNSLPEPTATAMSIKAASNVVELFEREAN